MGENVEYPHRWPCAVCGDYFRIKKDGTPTRHASRRWRGPGPCEGCTVTVTPRTAPTEPRSAVYDDRHHFVKQGFALNCAVCARLREDTTRHFPEETE